MGRCIQIHGAKHLLFMLVFFMLIHFSVKAQSDSLVDKDEMVDTARYFVDKTVLWNPKHRSSGNFLMNSDSNLLRLIPQISFQQMVKGNLSGVYVAEPSGEPGTDQSLFIQGLNGPLLTKKDLYEQQAIVYLNGIPLTRDHPFAYEIQKSDYLRIGTNTNNLAIAQLNNIASIEVIKDPTKLAALGPLVANGAIWVTTKNSTEGNRSGTINLYAGYIPVPRISTTNSAYEMTFRNPFYKKFASVEDLINMPAYLKDSTNADYYGPANWKASYYTPDFIYGADASLGGGTPRANFRLFLSSVRDAASADATGFQRNNASFFINVAPLKWLNFSSMIQYNRMDRKRNRSIIERLAEQRYIPDLANPLTPNKALYNAYLKEFNKAIDDNINNSLQSYFTVTARHKTLSLNSSIMVDYSDITRDVFWPKTLLENNNFTSHYLGVNQRVAIENVLSNDFDLGSRHSLKLSAKQSYITDFYRYKYAIGYNGPNDFVKLNLFHTNSSDTSYISYYYPNRIATALLSYSGMMGYTFNDLVSLNLVLRRDGSSTKNLNHRWFTSYAASFSFDLGKQIGFENSGISFTGGYARMGKPMADDRFSSGPIYASYVGWANEPTLGTYMGLPALSRTYGFGWVGNDLPWAYFEKWSFGATASFLKNRFQFGAEVYSRTDKNGALLVPTPAEWGYEGQYLSGLQMNNQGLDVFLKAAILQSEKGLNWNVNGNIGFNANKIKALPNGLDEIILSSTKLKVGERADAFWVYQNDGHYPSDAAVPINPKTNRPLTYNGVPFKAGDAKWADTNGDYDVNNEDRVLLGNYMPKQVGGWGTRFSYRGLSMDLQCYFALGQQYLNQYASSRLDFVNGDFTKALRSVKEITFWQKGEDLSTYPMYNPWSSLVPYQLNQTLFLQDASYMKLRSATLTYIVPTQQKRVKCMQVYISGNNLLTFSRFKGMDPESINYQGVYDGLSIPLVRSVTIGFKLDF